jgi:hypothetical protein
MHNIYRQVKAKTVEKVMIMSHLKEIHTSYYTEIKSELIKQRHHVFSKNMCNEIMLFFCYLVFIFLFKVNYFLFFSKIETKKFKN